MLFHAFRLEKALFTKKNVKCFVYGAQNAVQWFNQTDN